MSVLHRIVIGLFAWLATITSLHFVLNVDLSAWRNRRLPLDRRKLEVGYIPVT